MRRLPIQITLSTTRNRDLSWTVVTVLNYLIASGNRFFNEANTQVYDVLFLVHNTLALLAIGCLSSDDLVCSNPQIAGDELWQQHVAQTGKAASFSATNERPLQKTCCGSLECGDD